MSNVNFNFGSKDEPRGVGIVSIDSGDIYVNNERIGVTKSKYNEAVDQLEAYYDMLLENGLIEEEQTIEDKLDKALATIEQSNQTNAYLAEINKQLIERVERLEKGVTNGTSSLPSETTDAEIVDVEIRHDIQSNGSGSASVSNDAGKGTRGKPRGSNGLIK